MHPNGSAAAVVYAAKSTADERGSIPNQLRDCRAFADREDLSVVAEYSDEAASAWKGNRGPELAAAITHATEIGAHLIVQHSDRLARGDGIQARHLGELFFQTARAGVRLRSVQDDSSFDNPILAAVMGERNAEDSRRKGLAVEAGLARRRGRGDYVGHKPYGYRWQRNDDDKRVLVPDDTEAAVVRRIFAEYLAGESQLGITRALVADKVPTGRGGRWHQGTVRMLLANPVYAGMLRDGDGTLPGNHAPIIDMATWEKATALREAKARTHGRGRPPAGRHLFRKGFLRCGECGEAMVPRTARNRSGSTYEVYRCYGRHRDSANCSTAPVRRTDVDSAVYAYFEQVGLDVEATRDQLAAALDRKRSETEALLTAAQKDAARAAASLSRVKRDYKDGEIDAAEWRELRAELEPEADAAQAEVDRLAEQMATAEIGAALADAETEVLAQLAKIRAAVAGEVADAEGADAVRAVLLRLFDGFKLHQGVPGEAHVELIGTGCWIEPLVSEQAVAGFDDAMRPVLARVPLEQAGNNYGETLTT